MTPTQFRTAVRQLDLSLAEFARRCGTHIRTVRRWASGDRPVPEPIALLLACWLRERK